MSKDFVDITHAGSPGGFREFTGAQWGYHVRVKDPEGTGMGAEIWLDGQQVQHVKRYVVDVGLNRATEVTITVLAESVNREEVVP